MHVSQALDVAIVAALVAIIVQVTKPLFQAIWPDTSPTQNTMIRTWALLLSWLFVVLNAIDPTPLSFTLVRALLPQAFVVWGLLTATYHLFTGALPNVSSLMTPGMVDASPPPPKVATPSTGTPALTARLRGIFGRRRLAPAAHNADVPGVWKNPPEHLQPSDDMKQPGV